MAAKPAPTPTPFVAPIPTQILTAKKVFISNAGTEDAIRNWLQHYDADVNLPYDQLYAAVKNCGQ